MIREFIKKHVLMVGFLAVLAPLGVMLSLQYGWLVKLQKTSAVAEKASLGNYLRVVSKEIEYFYFKQAERSLNIPPDLLLEGRFRRVASYYRKHEVEGARYLFAVHYIQQEWARYVPDSALWNDLIEQLMFYDPYHEITGTPTDPSAGMAIRVALAPWRTLALRGDPVQSHAPVVDLRDPDNRMILKMITDERDRVIGVAGMIIESQFFLEAVLPGAIEQALPKFEGKRAQDNFFITVRDQRDRVVLGEIGEPEREEVSVALPFVFGDWSLAIGTRHTTPEQWAKSNFLVNLSMSVLLAAALLGGVTLALRTASHEVKVSQMKSDFVSNVSHELRTPLASIRVFGEFLRLGRVDSAEKSCEYGEYIETESRRLTQLINNILDFSKIESGAKTYEFERVSIEDIVADTVRTLAVGVKHRGFQLNYEGPESRLPEMYVDRSAIVQALTNLVDNARKYTHKPGDIDVALKRRADSVLISVRDRGIGISRHEQTKIFERFHRVSTGLVHDVKGSGLGLAIVQHVVHAHGGKISVESEPGRGSTFFINLPLRDRAQESEDLIVPAASVRHLEES